MQTCHHRRRVSPEKSFAEQSEGNGVGGHSEPPENFAYLLLNIR